MIKKSIFFTAILSLMFVIMMLYTEGSYNHKIKKSLKKKPFKVESNTFRTDNKTAVKNKAEKEGDIKKPLPVSAIDLDVTEIQVFNKNTNYQRQPSVFELIHVYKTLPMSELEILILKLEKFMALKQYVKKYNDHLLSNKEKLYFASLTNRLSTAKLVRLQSKLEEMELENEGT